ncbi:MAG TPA: Rv3235 family protein [Beutenbergiaceae bacterium]|nr:Rv3235 family protein [Beutenbergiaceae bacterium]
MTTVPTTGYTRTRTRLRTDPGERSSAAESVAGLAPIPTPPLRIQPTGDGNTWDPVRFTGPDASGNSSADEDAAGRNALADGNNPSARHRADNSHLPNPTTWAATLVRATVEVLKGRRPAAQLIRWLEADLWSALASRAQIGVQNSPGTARPAPVRVRRVHGCPITDAVWEGAVIINDGERTRAVALRLEVLRGRWCATALTIG